MNLETRPGRLPAGGSALACRHIHLDGRPNPKVLALPMKKAAQALRVPIDFDAHKADWIMFCGACAVAESTVDGVPYTLFKLEHELVIG